MSLEIDPNTLQFQSSALQLNNFRAVHTHQRSGGAGRIVFRCWGGLGDRVCAEPTIRWAFKNIPHQRFAIATSVPELFAHIGGERFVVSNDGERGDWNPEFWYELLTIVDQANPLNLSHYFIKHLFTHAVDYTSLHCFERQLPVADREIKLPDYPLPGGDFIPRNAVVVHPGKHWPSKTFPAAWWSVVCREILNADLVPVLVGQRVDENVGFVEFEAPEGALDLRNKLSLTNLVGLLTKTKCLVSNDSAPIHIAAAGDASIGVIATVKHPDYLAHWRKGLFGWGFQNLSRGGLYTDPAYWSPLMDHANAKPLIEIDQDLLYSFLPAPSEVGEWCANVFEELEDADDEL